jgi:hypothetical protein
MHVGREYGGHGRMSRTLERINIVLDIFLQSGGLA